MRKSPPPAPPSSTPRPAAGAVRPEAEQRISKAAARGDVAGVIAAIATTYRKQSKK